MPQRISLPPGEANARVMIIDSSANVGNVKSSFFFSEDSHLPGFEHVPAFPCWTFFISHSSGKKVLFDLGVRKDFEKLAQPIASMARQFGWDIKVEKDVSEILEENGVSLKEINSIVISHHHWDHIGNPSLFPSSTELVVGPGFKNEYFPGFPRRTDSPILESDYRGRNVREISFEEKNALRIGQFRAFDFFGDGSFYLLDTPGHTIGHLSGLVRTSVNPDTFIFMGADLCHHGGAIRPSPYLPIHSNIRPHPVQRFRPQACPGSIFAQLQEGRHRSSKQPFFDLSIGYDIPEATRTIQKAQEFDCDENVFFISAHDSDLRDIVGFFPLTDANDWKAKGWGEKARWAFLKDFEHCLRPGTQMVTRPMFKSKL